jgi:excisionase family DNA binding protein
VTALTRQADLIGAKEACRILDIHRGTLTRWVAKGRLRPAHKVPGRNGAFQFCRTDIEALAQGAGFVTAQLPDQPLAQSAAIAEHDDNIHVVHPIYVAEVARLGVAYERLRQENESLRDRVDALQAECEHWHGEADKWAARAITAECTRDPIVVNAAQ